MIFNSKIIYNFSRFCQMLNFKRIGIQKLGLYVNFFLTIENQLKGNNVLNSQVFCPKKIYPHM